MDITCFRCEKVVENPVYPYTGMYSALDEDRPHCQECFDEVIGA
jgi:hypothetical protein